MARSPFVPTALLAALAVAPVALAGDTPLTVTVTKAPVAPDGTTAGAVTDFVLTFVDRDPNVPGIGLPAGATVQVTLPADFVNTGTGGDNVIVLQGWPQSPIAPFPYDIAIVGNQITLTLTSDYLPGSDGEGGPGPKQVHLLLNGFTNPAAGPYDIPLMLDTGTGDTYSGSGTVEIIPTAVPSVNIVNFASGGGPPPPFNNAVYQDLAVGEEALLTRLFVWDAGSVPFVGLDLIPTSDPDLYTFMQNGMAVGQATIEPPPGASGYAMTTTGPSVDVPNPVTMVPTAGLDTRFVPDASAAGDYVISFELTGGNIDQQFIRVSQTTSYCSSTPNSTGQAATIEALGTYDVTSGVTSVRASGCPGSEPGIFIYGAAPGQVPFGNGTLCVSPFAPGLIRWQGFVMTDASGVADRVIDFANLPPTGSITAGSVWHFQFWFRDMAAGGSSFNMSDGVRVHFGPLP